jgi:hypothetical protein
VAGVQDDLLFVSLLFGKVALNRRKRLTANFTGDRKLKRLIFITLMEIKSSVSGHVLRMSP